LPNHELLDESVLRRLDVDQGRANDGVGIAPPTSKENAPKVGFRKTLPCAPISRGMRATSSLTSATSSTEGATKAPSNGPIR
jgi:hypothetical protein